MPSTYTDRGYELMATGEKTDTWGTITNTNLSLIDQNISGNLSVSTTGGTTSLTDSQAANVSLTITGTLTSAATIVCPDRGGFYFVSNATSGSYTVTVKTTTGTGVTVSQGAQTLVYSDGTNMLYGNNSGSTFVTGMMIPYALTTAPSGWVLCNGTTIGSASSGASQRQNADCQALFLALWPNTQFTVSSGRGASAAADWAANKTITVPDLRGRVIAGLDTMSATAASRLTTTTMSPDANTVAATGGVQTVSLTGAQTGPHTHTASADVAGDHTHTVDLASTYTVAAGSGTGRAIAPSGTSTTSTNGNHTHTITVNSAGSGDAHSNVQPTFLGTYLIKL